MDLDGLRVVHACWDDKAIATIKSARPNNEDITADFLHSACEQGNAPFDAVEIVLKGKEAELPEGYSFTDTEGHIRTATRIRWYSSPNGQNYRTYALTDKTDCNLRLASSVIEEAVPYPPDAKPVLRVNQLELGGECPHVVLNAGDEKNREGNSIPLRQDLADDLQNWLDDRRQRDAKPTLRFADAAGHADDSFVTSPVFVVPIELVKILKRKLKAADIAIKDDRGRVLDVHALRDVVRHAVKQGRCFTTNGSSGDASQRSQTHSERLHRSATLGRAFGVGCSAATTARLVAD